MKKMLAILLALMMVLVSVAALAAGEDGDTPANENPAPTQDDGNGTDDGQTATIPPISNGQNATTTNTITINKSYTFTVTNNATIPADEITFTVGKGTVTESTVQTAPTVTIDKITISEVKLTDDEKTDGKKYNLKINLPAFSEVGIYEYPITETIGNVVGVTYTPNEYVLKVTVIRNTDGNLVIAGIALREKGDNKPKTDTIENNFAGGDLTVGKTVTGNMGNQSAQWTIKVTFTAGEGKTVGNTISYTLPGADAATTIPAAWTGSKEVEITLTHGQTVKFENLPSGISYTVEETNPDSTYDEPSGEVKTATALTDGESAVVTIVNNKDMDIDTGVAMDSTVYMLIMALALAGIVVLRVRRREDY